MSKQIHFVVYWDSEDNRIHIDNEGAIEKFPDGLMYDTETKEWDFEEEDDFYKASVVLEGKLWRND